MLKICTAAVAVLAVSGFVTAETFYVAQDGSGDFSNIQLAIDASSDGDVINIAAGTYIEHSLNPGGKAITIQGTLNGDSSLATTIDSQEIGSIFKLIENEGPETVIKNLILTGGDPSNGGGINCGSTSPTIQNCNIQGNIALYDGGGIRCSGGSPTITDCTITDNRGGYGGGIYCYQGSPTITNCTITNNIATTKGGGIYCEDSNPTIINCQISNNYSADTGGGILNYRSNSIITDCLITDNRSYDDGAGLYSDDSSPVLENCTISSNMAGPDGAGGGVSARAQSTLTLIDCTLTQNNSNSSSGGGVYCNASSLNMTGCSVTGNQADDYAGGVFCTGGSHEIIQSTISFNSSGDAGGGLFIKNASAIITSCDINDNISGNSGGGGVLCFEASPSFTDCTISGNESYGPQEGGGMRCWSSNPTITNCRITNNSCNGNGGGIGSANGSNPAIANSNICGNTADQIAGGWTDNDGNHVSETCIIAQWTIESGGNGHWYQGIEASGITWEDASAAAHAVGGYLATVPNAPENEWVFAQIGSYSSLWNGNYGPFIGAYQDTEADDYSEPAGGWRWVTGELWDYTAWTTNDPSNSDGGQDHAAYGDPNEARWNDLESPFPGGYVIEWSADCNDDGIVDYGQIMDGTFDDADGNGIPDCCDAGIPCFPTDCNGNDIPDADEIADGTSLDCNGNDIPDECDLNDGTSNDCNSNGLPDECESLVDCNANGVADECETLADCNSNGIPDDCENLVDCNANGVPDECETLADCNANGVPDDCETLGDCDGDGTPDACEILNGAPDANPADGIPDACQGLPMGACCFNGGCLISTFDECFAAGGSFAGAGVPCSESLCPASCPGDVNGDNQIGIVDLLTIIDGWGICP